MTWTKRERTEYNQQYYLRNRERILKQTNLYKKELCAKRKISLYHWLMNAYRNMDSRASGKIRSRANKKPILSRKEFYRMGMRNWQLKEIYANWKRSGYAWHLTPSVDRINSNAGYVIGNIQFLTWYENSCKK
jgi:hypothetical protein